MKKITGGSACSGLQYNRPSNRCRNAWSVVYKIETPIWHPKCQQLCDMLSKHSIPEAFSHSDFRENNLLLDKKTGSINIIDWGETVIAHPFFSTKEGSEVVTFCHGLKLFTSGQYRVWVK